MAQAAPDYTDFAHTGPGTLAGRYMRRFWHPVQISKDLAAGRAMPITIMSEEVTLYRGESRAAHCVAFRCAHRGTQLSTGWVEGDELRCFYHGWKYGSDGQCTEQPAEPEPFCQRIGIRSYPTEEYLGLIFVYLGEGSPPPLPRYPTFEDEGIRSTSSYLRECNFFQNCENFVDETHVSFTHRQSHFTDNGLDVVPRITAEETDWGVTCFAHRPGDLTRATAFGMPNIGNVAGGDPPTEERGWEEFIAWRVPITDELHVSFNVHMVHIAGEAKERLIAQRAASRPLLEGEPANIVSRRVLSGEVPWADVEHRPDIVNIQDNVSQVGQGLIADRAHERLGQADVAIATLRRIWARELEALDQDHPLKEWRRTDRVHAMSGGVESKTGAGMSADVIAGGSRS